MPMAIPKMGKSQDLGFARQAQNIQNAVQRKPLLNTPSGLRSAIGGAARALGGSTNQTMPRMTDMVKNLPNRPIPKPKMKLL